MPLSVSFGLPLTYNQCKSVGMTLDEYFRTTSDNAAKMAARLGFSEASVSRIRNGGQNITLATGVRISAETGGRVSLDDLAAVLQIDAGEAA